MKNLINYTSAVLILLILPLMGWAQSTSYTVDESSTMVIKGTSTIHDWEADVEEMDINIKLSPASLQQDTMASPVESFSLTVPVESIESGKGRMNGKIYDALKKDDHPQITFKMTSAELTGNGTPEAFTLNVTGDLTIAGTTKQVSFPVNATGVNANSFRFEGNYSLNMEDYEVDPPSAMLGTIRSGEEVEIEFNILVTK
ncbi:MAG: YceI family protein [Balneolaceae bacterium]|nr:YceI family protein [Balneolaceae bacterium]